ncbi:hypothetical protein WG66_008233, partial [Moniliophthora roreri]
MLVPLSIGLIYSSRNFTQPPVLDHPRKFKLLRPINEPFIQRLTVSSLYHLTLADNYIQQPVLHFVVETLERSRRHLSRDETEESGNIHGGIEFPKWLLLPIPYPKPSFACDRQVVLSVWFSRLLTVYQKPETG